MRYQDIKEPPIEWTRDRMALARCVEALEEIAGARGLLELQIARESARAALAAVKETR